LRPAQTKRLAGRAHRSGWRGSIGDPRRESECGHRQAERSGFLRRPLPQRPTPTPQGNTSGAKSGGQIQQAVLISKKDPEYPKLARQTGARGQVKLTATVGKDGHVKSVKVISGHPMLQAAAVDAVKQWVYKPTLLNGQAVETDTEIVLNFVGDR